MKKEEIAALLDNMGDCQERKILQYMVDHGEISPLVALNECGCFRLSARIHDLKDRGVLIDRRMEDNDGKRWAVYSLRVAA